MSNKKKHIRQLGGKTNPKQTKDCDKNTSCQDPSSIPQKPIRDYDKLRRAAYEYVVVQGHDQKEVSELLSVSEPTISKWSQEGHWREERKSRQLCSSSDADNTRQILRLLSEKRLQLEYEITEAQRNEDSQTELDLRKMARGLSDEISKANKTLMNLDKENHITLGVYIDVMDDIFNAMRLYDEDLFLKCVDFQALHIRKKTLELG